MNNNDRLTSDTNVHGVKLHANCHLLRPVQYCPVLVVIVQTIFESLLSMFQIDLINPLEIQNTVTGVVDILFHQIYFDSPNLRE